MLLLLETCQVHHCSLSVHHHNIWLIPHHLFYIWKSCMDLSSVILHHIWKCVTPLTSEFCSICPCLFKASTCFSACLASSEGKCYSINATNVAAFLVLIMKRNPFKILKGVTSCNKSHHISFSVILKMHFNACWNGNINFCSCLPGSSTLNFLGPLLVAIF